MSSHTDAPEPIAEGVNRNHPLAAHLDILDREQAIILPPIITPAQPATVDRYDASLVVPAVLEVRAARRTKVVLVGFAQTTMNQAPFNDPEVEIWGLNQIYRHIPRADRYFEIHSNWNENVVEGTDHVAWLNAIGCPVYMNEIIPEIKNSVRYPVEKIIEFFQFDYFTSTIAYMLALAIAEGFEWIGIFGIDLIMGPEYEFQKPCVEWYLGVAHGLDIAGKKCEVYLPEYCALCTQPYRYGTMLEPPWPVTPSAVEGRRTALLKDKEAAQVKIATLDGAIQENGHWLEALRLGMRGAGNILQLKRK